MSNEPRMQVRDADLRRLIHRHGAARGTDLHRALAELQTYRDAEGAQGPSAGPPLEPRDRTSEVL